jgi:hypothetical protein
VNPLASTLRGIGVEPSERALFGWAGLCLTQIGAASFALLVSSETLFLKRVGVETLPWALLASAALLVATTGLASHALAGADRPRWLPRVLLGLAASLLPFWWMLDAWRTPGLFVALLLLSRQLLVLSLLVFWVALGDLLTGRRAKRLFAPLASALSLGAIAGSFASNPVARLVGVDGLLLVCAMLLVGAAGAGLQLRAACPRRFERGVAAPREPGEAGGRVPAARIWRQSPLFRLLLAPLLFGGLLSSVLYFEFSYIADAATTGPDAEERLLALFAKFRGWLNVAVLFTQLWLSARLYRRVGLPLSLVVWPASCLLGFGWLGIQPGLLAGISAFGAGRFAEIGVGSAALRVLFNLFPESLRPQATALLQGPVERLGGALGNAAVLLALALGTVHAIAYAAIPVAAVWLIAALALWRAYPGLLLQASAQRSLAGVGTDKAKLLDPGTVRALAPSLADPDPGVCRAASDLVADAEPLVAAGVLAEALEKAPTQTRDLLVDALHRLVEPLPAGHARSKQAVAALARLLAEPSRFTAEERADLVQVYARLTGDVGGSREEDRASTELLQRALGDREAAVRLAAIAELHRRGKPPPGVADLDAVLRSSLGGSDVIVRRSARKELRAMLLSTEPDQRWYGRLELLAERLQQRADRAETAEALMGVARRHNGAAHPCAERVARWLGDRDPRVRAATLRFLGNAGVIEEAPRLVAALASRNQEEAAAAREGLVALGPEAAQPLLVEYEFGAPAQRDAVTAVLRELDVDSAALDDLYSRQLEGVRNTVMLRAALRSEDPAALLLRRLEERVAEGLGALLAFCAVRYDDERIAELERRLRRAPDDRSRDILVEAIEALLPSEKQTELVPLLEAGSWAERGRRAVRQLGRPPPSAREARGILIDDGDALTRRLARAFAPGGVEEPATMGDPLEMIDSMNIAAHLQNVAAFDRLSTRQLVGLAEALKEERYGVGDFIYTEGDEGNGLYFVVEGEVEISKGDQPLERLGPWAFFGELSSLDGVPRSASARARESVQLLRLDRENLLELMEDTPALGIGLSQFLSLRVRALQEQLGSR